MKIKAYKFKMKKTNKTDQFYFAERTRQALLLTAAAAKAGRAYRKFSTTLVDIVGV